VSADRRTFAGLVLVLVAGAILRLWGLQFGLPHPFARPDEEVMVDLALGIQTDPNPHFFDWGTLFPYAIAGVYAIFFALERTIGGAMANAGVARTTFDPVLILIPRALSAAAGLATVAVVFATARDLLSRRAALLAALFLAVVFLHVRDSHFGVADVPMTFLTICAFWLSVRCATRGATLGRTAITGLLCGLAVSTKYTAAPIVLAAMIAVLWTTVGAAPRNVGLAVRAIAVLGACAAVGFVAATPYAVLDSATFLTAMANVRRHMESGHILMTRGWEYHLTFTLRYGVGVPLLASAVAGPIALLAERRRKAAALLLAFPVSYYALVGSGKSVFVRYMVPMVPFLCLGAAVFVDWLSEQVARILGSVRAGHIAAACCAAVVAVPTLVPSILFDRLMARPDTRATAAERVVSEFPLGASMYQNGYTYTHLQMSPRDRYPQYTFNEETKSFEHDGIGAGAPDVIVLFDSALPTYTSVPPPVAALVHTDYTMVTNAVGIATARMAAALYDQDDAFFAPFTGIDEARRPGPNITIYRRRDAHK
jgi:4-amino-4-deoxy-L-arabinose transferase-like glycosyltransferase